MKKIALAAFSATALLALSACGDAAEEAPAEEAVVEEVAPIEPIAEDTAAVDAAAEEATDAAAEATDDAMAADTSVVGPTDTTPGTADPAMTAEQRAEVADETAEDLEERADAVEDVSEAEADRLDRSGLFDHCLFSRGFLGGVAASGQGEQSGGREGSQSNLLHISSPRTRSGASGSSNSGKIKAAQAGV